MEILSGPGIKAETVKINDGDDIGVATKVNYKYS